MSHQTRHTQPSLRRIVMYRSVNMPRGNGPINGQYALQRALVDRIVQDNPRGLADWFSIEDYPRTIEDDEVPWFWSWQDHKYYSLMARQKRDFIVGPNVLFRSHLTPGAGEGERDVLDASTCILQFTESEWYEKLIRANLGPESPGRIVLWPYPILPVPPGPVLNDPLCDYYDLLIYAKGGPLNLIDDIRKKYPNHKFIRYGHYTRDELWDVASRSRACLYMSESDRGPLAQEEILLCGCPVVGIPISAPFAVEGATGVQIPEYELDFIYPAIQEVMKYDREAVSEVATSMFDTQKTVDRILLWLSKARRGWANPNQ